MTTSTNNDAVENIRDIDEILDLPYSELSEEEIERVIQFRADVQTRDRLHDQAMKQLSDAIQEAADAHLRMANKAQQRLEELTAHAIARFEDVSNE